MDFGACGRCKKIIAYEGINLCNECRTYYFKTIRDYLYENKNCNNVELSRNLNIPLSIVNYFIKEGDLIDTASRYNETRDEKVKVIKELGNELKKDLSNKKSMYNNVGMRYIKTDKKR